MLSDNNVGASIAVKDLAAANKFYTEVLGLKQEGDLPNGGGTYYKSGQSSLLVYPSQYAGTNQATYAGWTVEPGSLEEVVDELKGKGVSFEHYPDFPGVTLDGDIHSWDGQGKSVWFKDPDGNILAVSEM